LPVFWPKRYNLALVSELISTGASFVGQQDLSPSPLHNSRKAELLLLLLFLLSLPLLNPWVRGDGVGYYAFARALLIQHDLNFDQDYQRANASFREARLDESGVPKDRFRTQTGHLENHFSIGPAVLWSPFLIAAHAGVLIARALGSQVAANGFSPPYRDAMAVATALYGFLGLLLSFRLAKKYVSERSALIATIAIWGASSLPVYMYFNPSWSHAQSAFTVALFLTYWHKTRNSRALSQWVILALLAGLMLNVYYANAMLLMVLAIEALRQYAAAFRDSADINAPSVLQLLTRHILFWLVTIACLTPTFLVKHIIYGSSSESGYIPVKSWAWRSPYFFSVLFSTNHGLFSWTPILLIAILGLFLFVRRNAFVGLPLLAAVFGFYYFIASYPDWAGISSYGNRFFVSLTCIFILGLAVLLDHLAKCFQNPRTSLAVISTIAFCFILWNAGLIFQWGSHLIPARGTFSYSKMVHNQFHAVPSQLSAHLNSYFFHRKALMNQIEQRDMQQIKNAGAPQE